MSFSFNFSGDDIDGENPLGDAHGSRPAAAEAAETPSNQPEVPVVEHDLKDLLSTIPSQISYTSTHIISPQHGRQAVLPRRALFDVRMQLMAEDDPAAAQQSRLPDTDTDIQSNVYEGGFKSWEGAADLATLLLDRGPRKDPDEIAGLDAVIELGAGAALPSLALLDHALRADLATAFILADYNAAVLRLVTLPNLLLVWAVHGAPHAFSPGPPHVKEDGTLAHGDGELDVSPELLDAFSRDLSARGVALKLLSGPWAAPALATRLCADLMPCGSALVLAAETIYSPASLSAFADVLAAVLHRSQAGKAFVAAKRVYFGVGGGVDAFKEAMGARRAVVSELMGTGIEACERGAGGVGRCLMEVQLL